jgi:hypothetical protein
MNKGIFLGERINLNDPAQCKQQQMKAGGAHS